MGALFKTREGLRCSIDTLQWRLEAYDYEREACARSLKQLENALADAPSTDEEKDAVAKERKAESSKHGASHASSSEEEEEEEEESEEEEDAEEDELVGSSGVSSKAKGKGRAK